jgi:hypothetical protein
MRYSARPARSLFYLSRFSALGVERSRRGTRRPRSAEGPGRTATFSRRGEDYDAPGPPHRLKKVVVPPFKMRGRAPSLRRALQSGSQVHKRASPRGTWLWTCQKPCGYPPSGKQKAEPFKILEARKDPWRKTEGEEVWAGGPATIVTSPDL